MKKQTYNEAVDTLKEYDDVIVISDNEITINGTQIDTIRLEKCWDGGEKICFYAGRPDLDGTEDEGEWEELELSDKEQEKVLKEVLEWY